MSIRKKSFIITTLVLLVASTSIPAFATTVDSTNSNKEGIQGYSSYTYSNAPNDVRAEHEANCKSIGIEPLAEDPILVPDTYGVKNKSNNTIQPMYVPDWNDGYLLSYNDAAEETMTVYKIDVGNFYVSKSALVGYNYTTRGDAVTLLQIILNRSAKYGQANTVIVDGIFGSASHSSLIKYQDTHDLSTDAIAGRNTWNCAREIFDIHAW